MTVCLYECLTAAGLQRYYARFTLMGFYRAAHLSTLRMEDYPLLGVCSMEDRARLFQLVQLVKNLDRRSLTFEDIGIYNGPDYEGGEDVFPLHHFSSDGYENPNGDVRKDKEERGAFRDITCTSHHKPSCIDRRLDFSAENTEQRPHHEGTFPFQTSHDRNDDTGHENGSARPVQPRLHSRCAVLCELQRSKNRKLNELGCSCDPHNGESTQLHVTRGASLFNYPVKLVPKSKAFQTLNPNPPGGSFDNKPSTQKTKRKNSGKKNCSFGVTKSTPVYEAKRKPGYNYGVPLSSPQASKRVGGQRISVCVRKRPLTRAESRRGEADVVTTPSGECVVVHENKEAVDLTEYILQHSFRFDQVFGEESSNEEIYQKTTYPLVQHMLSGGKATCFAYGQTGAGKTHTMLGSSPGGAGLYAMAVRDIFAHLSTTQASLLVYVSFFEIYCGQLYDLLGHRKRLFAREDGKKVVHISGLRDVKVDSVNSLLEVISQGRTERTQGMSGVNPLSSRSHALLQIQLRDLNQQITGRMWFVDLAGSERASDSKEPNKLSRMEGAEINQSLLALKECIRSLDKEESHTPFRQSKLTQVLKDSFVGDSMTCMIANISPGQSATEQTLNTLRYADRVKELRGQSGLTGRRKRRQNNTAPSGKNNIFDSGNSNRRNRGNNGNQKLGNQKENFNPKIPTTRPHAWDKVFSSTPKKSMCEAEAESGKRQAIDLEHITPIRGWLAQSESRCLRKGAELRHDWRAENERYNDIHSSCVKGKHTTAVGMLSQQNKGDVNGVNERESGFFHRKKVNHQQTMNLMSDEAEWTEMRMSCRDSFREEEGLKEREFHKADDNEKVRHLRKYHQQLQQFLPSPISSSVHPLSSSTSPSFSSSTRGSLSSLLHLSNFTSFTYPSPCIEETSDEQTETSAINHDSIAKGDKDESERKVMAHSAHKVTIRKSLADGRVEEIRCYLVGNKKMESQQIPATAIPPFLGANNSNTFICPFYSDRDQKKESRKRCPCYVENMEELVNDEYAEFPLSQILHMKASATSDAVKANGHHERQKNTTTAVSERGSNLPSSLHDHDNNEKKQSTMKNNINASILKPQALSFIQSDSNYSASQSSHKTLEYACNMGFKTFSNISKQHSVPLSISAHPGYCNYSDIFAELNNHPELVGQESSNQQIKPTINLFTTDRLDHARFCIIEAHLEQLKEMEAICHKEGQLLCQQHDMAFVEFVRKLAEILERKAQCVDSMRDQLKEYLSTNHHPTSNDCDNA